MKQQPQSRKWYDILDDWELIEASFAKQYGIRLRREPDMTWAEFSALLSGLMPDTPLGEVVSIRSETDRKRIERFTPAQRRIYDEWAGRGMKVQADEAAYASMMAQMEAFFLALGGVR